MTKTLTFLHTAPVHMATFDALLAELAPAIPIRHLVNERLLRDARAVGITPDLIQLITTELESAYTAGAALILCTCSTIGGCAEQAGQAGGIPVLRIDRPMAEQAAAIGGRILIAAALSSTLAPTRELLLDAARQANKSISLNNLLCADAWEHFERRDLPAYHAAIARQLRSAAPGEDGIVLAQASMAGAMELCPDIRIPILSSPRLGLEAAIRTYHDLIRPN